MVRDGIGELREYARPAGMPLAISHCIRCTRPIAPVSTPWRTPTICATSWERASASRSTSTMSGGTRTSTRIARAGGHVNRLLAYHICDWLVPTTDLLLDRGMMGDGVIDLPRIRGWMEDAGYRGAHEVEIFSARNWWTRDPDEVLQTCKARHREVS
jgi:hypothetical protein